MAYFPNATAGEVLDAQCEECPLGELACPVYMAQSFYNYEAVGNNVATSILDQLVDEETKECQMKKMILEENIETRSGMIKKLKKHNKLWRKNGKTNQNRN